MCILHCTRKCWLPKLYESYASLILVYKSACLKHTVIIATSLKLLNLFVWYEKDIRPVYRTFHENWGIMYYNAWSILNIHYPKENSFVLPSPVSLQFSSPTKHIRSHWVQGQLSVSHLNTAQEICYPKDLHPNSLHIIVSDVLFVFCFMILYFLYKQN